MKLSVSMKGHLVTGITAILVVTGIVSWNECIKLGYPSNASLPFGWIGSISFLAAVIFFDMAYPRKQKENVND